MFSDWIEKIEETEEQKNLKKYKKIIIDLNLPNDDQIFVLAFTGGILGLVKYIEIINKINNTELINLCIQLFPNILINEYDLLKPKKLVINGIQFTNDQQKACNNVIDFLYNTTQKQYGLYGFSGTGKTFTIVEIVSYLLKNKLIKAIAFSAPTNQAVNVMKSKFENSLRDIYKIYSGKTADGDMSFDDIIWKLYEYGILIEFCTTHKLLSFESDRDNEGKLIFKRNKDCDFWKFGLIVIDECSMLSAKMADTIFSEIRKEKKSIKVVFSGDIAQLPPVNELNSIIFSKEKNHFPFDVYLSCFEITQKMIEEDKKNGNVFNELKLTQLEKKYHDLMNDIIAMEHFVMQEVVRSKSKDVLGVCGVFRDLTLGISTNKNISAFIKGTDCKAFRNDPKVKKINSDWFKQFTKDSKAGKDSIILTWTNKQCNEYNGAIRSIIFGSESLDRFKVGDVLILADYYNMKESKCSEATKFHTSEQIKVTHIEFVDKRVEKFPETLNKKTAKLEHVASYEQLYKKRMDLIYENISNVYKCWKLTVKRLSGKMDDSAIIYVIHEDDEDKYKAELDYVNRSIQKLRTVLVTKFKEKTTVIDNHIISQLWKDFDHLYNRPFANINYGYCITCHKGQGSTFYNVYVDMEDITKNSNTNEMRRCLYTAISRTSNILYLLI